VKTKITSTTRMGAVVELGTGASARVVSLSPAAVKAVDTFPAESRGDVIAAAADVTAARGASRITDADVLIGSGVKATEKAVAAARKERGLATPSIPWPTRRKAAPSVS
jgi:hypothetical protein